MEFPCQLCGTETDIVWFADNDLWNEVNGSPNGFMCPECFNAAATDRNRQPIWHASDKRPSMLEAADELAEAVETNVIGRGLMGDHPLTRALAAYRKLKPASTGSKG